MPRKLKIVADITKPERKATEWIQIRCTVEEKRVIEAKADAAGKAVATFMRDLALKGAPR